MKIISNLAMLALIVTLLMENFVHAQDFKQQPFDLTISKEVIDGMPIINVIVTNVANRRKVPVLSPDARGLIRNLTFEILPQDGDTIFVDVHKDLTTILEHEAPITALKPKESISCSYNLFGKGYDLNLNEIAPCEIRAIYFSVYQTPPDKEVTDRSSVYHKDVYSNKIFVE